MEDVLVELYSLQLLLINRGKHVDNVAGKEPTASKERVEL